MSGAPISALALQRMHISAAKTRKILAMGKLQAARYQRDHPGLQSPSPQQMAKLIDDADRACAKHDRAWRVYAFLAGPP